jgi:hypothetical protein
MVGTSPDDGQQTAATTLDISLVSAAATSFAAWRNHDLPHVVELAEDQLTDLLVEIVPAEGPMLCRRLYNVFADASGAARRRL